MPNAFRHLIALNGTLQPVRASGAGPGAYNAAARPQMILPCKEIVDYGQVRMWSNSGYVIRPVGLTTPHTVQYMAMTVNRTAAVGAVLNHAVHAHDILVKNAASGSKMNVVATDYQSQAATATIAGDAAGGGITSTVQAHGGAGAALKDIPGLEEVLNGTNLAGVTVYAQAWARVR